MWLAARVGWAPSSGDLTFGGFASHPNFCVRTLKLTLAYDGAPFHGWQIQPGKLTIQGLLAEALASLTGEPVLPQGSGRTDAGVHALGQVASFATASRIPTSNIQVVLNDRLPAEIRVLAIEEVDETFHARHSAHGKQYRYRIYRGSIVPPFLARYVTHYPYRLDEAAMQQAAALVVGEHDFTSFAAADPDRAQRIAAAQHGPSEADAPSNTRTIDESRFEREGDELIYLVRGSGFLHHMVRNLVGTFLLVGKGSLTPTQIPSILAARDRRLAGPTAPPTGLYLAQVDY